MDVVEYQRPGYAISTDPARLQIPVIHKFLSECSYWAKGRPLELVEKSIGNSLCFGIYDLSATPERQAGFARLVTDYVTFAWLCDVFVLEAYRGEGLGKWLVECVVNHAEMREIKRMVLSTRDADGLYRDYGGFEMLSISTHWMVRSGKNPRWKEHG